MTRSNPTVARQQLAVLLNRAREQNGRSLDELARFLSVSGPQASRLDSGARGFRPDDVRRLSEWYGFPAPELVRLLALAEESRRREWWQQIDLNPSYRTLIGMEQAALTVVEYGVSVVPGLLQTREYARVAASVGDTVQGSRVQPEKVDQAIEVRMRRQGILDQPTPPRLSVVVDEAILARGPSDRDVRLAQLRHLRRSAERPGVTIQVIGFEYGLHSGANSHFILLAMGAGVPDLFYSQGLGGDLASTDPEVVQRYRLMWMELRAKALDESASCERIDHYIRELSDRPSPV